MPYAVEYFHARVLKEIESWPVDILADYARLMELMMEHGPNLRLPHSRAMAKVCLNFVLKVQRALVADSIAS